MRKYDTVLWDLDGTLLDFELSSRYALALCLKERGVTMTEEMFALYSRINDGFWERLERGEIEKEELRPGRFLAFFRQIGLDHMDPRPMQEQYEREVGTKTYYRDDSFEIVAKLKEMGIKQHIVTNGVLVTQRIKMKNSGLDKLIDKVFISDVIGFEKPGREFFETAFRELPDFRRERALLVGDSLTSDMRGANNAGVDACWYNPGGKPLCAGDGQPVHAEYEIRNLSEVFGILGICQDGEKSIPAAGGGYVQVRKAETETTVSFKDTDRADG